MKYFVLAFSYVNLVYRGKEWFALVSIFVTLKLLQNYRR